MTFVKIGDEFFRTYVPQLSNNAQLLHIHCCKLSLDLLTDGVLTGDQIKKAASALGMKYRDKLIAEWVDTGLWVALGDDRYQESKWHHQKPAAKIVADNKWRADFEKAKRHCANDDHTYCAGRQWTCQGWGGTSKNRFVADPKKAKACGWTKAKNGTWSYSEEKSTGARKPAIAKKSAPQKAPATKSASRTVTAAKTNAPNQMGTAATAPAAVERKPAWVNSCPVDFSSLRDSGWPEVETRNYVVKRWTEGGGRSAVMPVLVEMLSYRAPVSVMLASGYREIHIRQAKAEIARKVEQYQLEQDARQLAQIES